MIQTGFWSNPFVETAGYFSVVVFVLSFRWLFLKLSRNIKTGKKLKKVMLQLHLATGGKIFGVCNIFRYSIEQHNSFFEMIGWGLFGFTLLIFAYLLFEFLTPKFNVDKEIEKDNRSVGFISFIISVGLSFVIGASIS